MPYRDRPGGKAREEQTGEERVDEDWVGSSLLSAMDKMGLHVDEMLNTEAQPVPPQAAASANSSADNITTKDQIYKEINHIVDRKVSATIDAAITARIQRLAAAKLTSNSADFTAKDSRILRDLDVLHRHEADLNTKLVQRLFQVDRLTRETPEQRFARTTADLQGTDSVVSVLVSHVEALVAKVEALQKKVGELEVALANKGGGLPY